MKTVQDLFFEARGVEAGRQPRISRRQLVEMASQLPGAPDDLTERHLESLEKGTRPPPGPHLLYFAAAAGISILDLLAASPICYWPEVGGENGRQAAFLDLCRRWNLEVTSQIGHRFVVEVPE